MTTISKGSKWSRHQRKLPPQFFGLVIFLLGVLGLTAWHFRLLLSHIPEPLPLMPSQLSGQPTKSPSGQWDKWIIADVCTEQCEQHLGTLQGWQIMCGVYTEGTGGADGTHANSKRAIETFMFNSNLSDADNESVHVWRKNAALLSAVAQGAVTIVETDCSVAGTQLMQGLERQGPRHQGLMYNDTLLFNPYAHSGAWALAPRAALHTGLWNNSRLYHLRDFSSVLVKHCLSPSSADAVVVIPTQHDVGRRFDPSSPPVYVGQRSFAPVVADCSLYHGQALWAVLDPCLSPGLHCRVLRSLLQQRLLRELDAFSGYYQITSSPVHENVSLSNWRADSAGGTDQRTTYSADGINLMEAATYLNNWKCGNKFSFNTCFRKLVQDLGAKGYVKQAEKVMMISWIAALKALGVENAVRVKSPWRGLRKVSEVRVTFGSVQTRLEHGGRAEESHVSQLLVDPVLHHCRHASSGALMVSNMSLWKAPVIEDLVLILVFNSNSYFWSNLPYLETMHRPFFKHIVYCVPDMDQLVGQDEHGALQHLTLLEGLSDDWFLFYGCVTQMMVMHLAGVRGYVQIGDDVLLNTWRLLDVSRDVMLVHECGQMKELKTLDFNWQWWLSPRRRCAVIRTMAGLEKISECSQEQLLNQSVSSSGRLPRTYTDFLRADQHSSPNCPQLPGSEDWPEPSSDEARRFLHNLYHVHGMTEKVRINRQDFLYMPSKADYIPLSRYFMKHKVMAELAAYNLQLGLTNGSWERKTISATNAWGWDRSRYEDSPWKSYNLSHYYLHPFKLSTLHKKQRKIDFFCDTHLTNLVSQILPHTHKKGDREN